MMAFVIRKNSHVDYDSHTSYTCLHLFLFGVAAVCSPLLSIRYQQEHCAVFSCAKDPSVGKQYMAESLQDMWLFFFGRYFAFEITDPVIVCDVQLLGLQLRHQYTQMLCFLAVMGKTLVMCVRDTERLLLLMMVLLSMLVLQNDSHT